jgi:cyclopropane-fatty-acyl-phospholipid synthase
MAIALTLAESGWVPDAVTRLGIRSLLRERLREIRRLAPGEASTGLPGLESGPVALVPELANRQHYEVDPELFRLVLGPHLKYSCGYWPEGVADLEGAEAAMLGLCAERAEIRDGMRVLDLGCGWGSFSLWLAERYPRAQVLGVSNSKRQRDFILERARRRGLGNLEVETADANSFEPEGRFDRVVSVEMFEHMRNWRALLARIERWLEPEGKLFVHVFCHRSATYAFEDRGPGDWMARHFFSGGMMPSQHLLPRLADGFQLEEHWRVSGEHYRRTCEAWLARLDAERVGVRPALDRSYGPGEATLWLQRWRLFFLACSELFGFHGGEEWFVSHYRLARRRAGRP